MKKIYIYLLLILTLFFSGCSLLLYMPPIQQGNDLSSTQVAQIKPGMTAATVVKLLGSPVLVNTFRDNTLEYVYTYKIRGKQTIEKKLIIYLSGNRVSRIEC